MGSEPIEDPTTTFCEGPGSPDTHRIGAYVLAGNETVPSQVIICGGGGIVSMRCAVCYLVLSVLLSLTRRYCVECAERIVRLFQHLRIAQLLWSPYGIGQTIVFLPCGFFFFFLLSSFFP